MDLTNEQFALGFALVVVLVLLYKCYKKKEYFSPWQSTTWEDWDNYAKNQGNTRAYWGNMAEGGGWEGDPTSPVNNPSGIAAQGWVPGQSSPIGIIPIRNYNMQKRVKEPANLAEASEQQLKDLYRAGIMEARPY